MMAERDRAVELVRKRARWEVSAIEVQTHRPGLAEAIFGRVDEQEAARGRVPLPVVWSLKTNSSEPSSCSGCTT